ncbi:hypothetical protein BDP55DRAFT_734742 [Colletotrichum godetiae]|uniref:PNPLA domain-containing protein n=1 Tax=Colletotrichum godetiae TaxID=1209918 RepID=A0AAJ0EQP1_9PEZI|nr:uncharacterized protein BDP55DRAFT_734742 [Colletotrichum godetiae]KAK1657663.1 hypothetical protein BDP55DRAFT_734742 [Colletotrichum godetiae]
MRSREETCWLKLRQRGDSFVGFPSCRLSDILDRNRGHPSLFCCIGSSGKDEAMRWLTTVRSGRRDFGDIHLQLDKGARSIHTERPLLFADITTYENASLPLSDAVGDFVEWPLEGCSLVPVTAYSVVLGALTDVLCVFLSDTEGMRDLVNIVSSWTKNPLSLPLPLPRLVVVVERAAPGDCSVSQSEREVAGEIRNILGQALPAKFSALSVHFLCQDKDLASEHRYRRLRDLLVAESDRVREKRVQSHALFQSRHFTTLAGTAYKSFRDNLPVDLVQASRVRMPIPHKMQHHIQRFLHRFGGDEASLRTFALPYLCSAMMLDAFPPGMHNFAPEQVYRSLYKPIVVRALHALRLPRTHEALVERIVRRLHPRTGSQSRRYHRKCMLAYARRWRNIFSDRDCLVCLARAPEYPLSCGHAICAVDVRRMTECGLLPINACPLCARPVREFKYKGRPKTKGVNVLSIDGGGIRGIIPLQILRLVEQKLSSYLPDYPVQNHFDLAVGTSSGGLIVLGAFLKGLSMMDCMKMLRTLSTKVFRCRLPWVRGFQGPMLRLAMVYLFGSIYPSRTMDTFLHSIFGDNTLFGHHDAPVRGAKVAVTATGVPKGGFVLTNYNGAGSDDKRHGYKHVRTTRPADRLKITDAARATTAAPGFFLPHTLLGIGEVQDGALCGLNNPEQLAERESRSLWPGSGRPDVLVSAGTGYVDPQPKSPLSPTGWKPPRRGFSVTKALIGYVSSLAHVIGSFLDGEVAHTMRADEPTSLKRPHKYFRCNVKFDDHVPALDDVTAIDRLRERTESAFRESHQIGEISAALLSTMFYFELIARPVRNRSSVSCVGRIVCHLDAGEGLDHLITSLRTAKAEFFIADLAVPVGQHRLDHRRFRFEQSVHVEVQNLDAQFPISLRTGGLSHDRTPVPISASPFTLRGLTDAQGWNNHFGCDDFGPTSPAQIRKRRLPMAIAGAWKKSRLSGVI